MDINNIIKDGYVIKKNDIGYYEVINKPTEEELNNFYSTNLYQEPEKYTSTYKCQYSDEEIEYIENKSKKIFEIVKNVEDKYLLDIGCGEGYVSRFFKDKGYKYKSLDYSSYGIECHNPSILDHFIKGDVLQNLDKIITEGEKFGIIILNNVIEHVLNPSEILCKIKLLLNKDSVLIVTAPNDFSDLHMHLIDNNMINNMSWLSPPMHLSYFNIKSLTNLIKLCGYKVMDCYSEYPIDLDLLVENTNYINNKQNGKYSHLKRLRVDNFMCKQSIIKTVDYYRNLAKLNLGRDIVLFIQIN